MLKAAELEYVLSTPQLRRLLVHICARTGCSSHDLVSAGLKQREVTEGLVALQRAGAVRSYGWQIDVDLETRQQVLRDEASRTSLLPLARTMGIVRLLEYGRQSDVQVGAILDLLRLQVYSGDPGWQKTLLSYKSKVRFYLQAPALVPLVTQPFSAKWFKTLPSELQDAVLLEALQQGTFHFETDEDLMARVHTAPARLSPETRYAYCEHLLLAGHAERAGVVGKDLPQPWSSCLEGFQAFYQGRYGESVTAFERAGDVPEHMAGLLYLMALLQLRTPDSLQKLVRMHRKLTAWHPCRVPGRVLTTLAEEALGKKAAAFDTWSNDFLLHSHWMPILVGAALASKDLPYDLDGLSVAGEEAELEGFDWVVEAVDELQAFAQERSPITHPLLRVLPWQNAWERKLDTLCRLATETAGTETRTQRVIWKLWENAGKGHLESYVQSFNARRGGWNPGKQLWPGQKLPECATPQDIRIFNALSWGRYDFEGTADDVFLNLVDHPDVYDLQGRRVKVVKDVPRLRIESTPAGYKVRLDPPGGVMLRFRTPTEAVVTVPTPLHLQLGRELGRGGLELPHAATARLMQMVEGLQNMVTVESAVDLTASLERVPCDGRLRINMQPAGEGLKVELRVQPLGEGTRPFPPGQGPAVVTGDARVTTRDLAAELAATADLCDRCPSLLALEAPHYALEVGDAEQALALLSDLQALGEAVLVQWPQGQKLKVLQRSASSFKFRVSGERDWFEPQGELQVDEARMLALAELFRLMGSGRRFLPLGDGQFLELTDAFRRQLKTLSRLVEPHRGKLRLHALSAPTVDGLMEGFAGVSLSQGWQRQVARLRDLSAVEVKVPSTLQAELRGYQEEGFRWLSRLAQWGIGACLADDMGLGKTIQTLALLLSRAAAGPALVVAPASVCHNWLSEVHRYAPTLSVHLFNSADDREALLTAAGPNDLVVVSYTLMQLESEAFSKVAWHTLVLDEAQAIKNTASKRFDAACALRADARVVLTGTPVENHLGELWAIFRFLNPGLLGTQESFNTRFANPIERGRDASARAALRQLLSPYVLRRRKADVLDDLPPCTETTLLVDPTPEEATQYEALRLHAQTRMEGEENHLRILAEITRLRRFCCHPGLVTGEFDKGSSKLGAFLEVLDELRDNGHRALVFSQFVDHLTLVRKALDTAKVPYQYLDGSTAMKERQRAVEAFQGGAGDVFLISLKAGGVGLNLTAADYVIHLDPWWNPAVEDQASMRSHRIGQQRPVTVYRLIARGTIEEKILELHRDKRDLADQLLDGTDVGGKLSVDELRRLLQAEV